MKSNREGLFITIEGGERSGKSTLIQKLFSHFSEVEGKETIKSFEPGGTPFGKIIRGLLLTQREVEISPRAELLLFLADRAHHVESVIKPALERGAVVLVDRFTDSSLAYQGAARKLDADKGKLEEVCAFGADNLVPDVTFYLDLEPEVGLSRITEGKDRVEDEKIEFHKKVREGYLNLAKEHRERIYLIDARKSAEEVFLDALKILQQGSHGILATAKKGV